MVHDILYMIPSPTLNQSRSAKNNYEIYMNFFGVTVLTILCLETKAVIDCLQLPIFTYSSSNTVRLCFANYSTRPIIQLCLSSFTTSSFHCSHRIANQLRRIFMRHNASNIAWLNLLFNQMWKSLWDTNQRPHYHNFTITTPCMFYTLRMRFYRP